MLLLSLYWRGLTTKGAVVGGATGLASAVILTVIGPTVWVKILGNDRSPRAALDRGNFEGQLSQSLRAPAVSA